MIILTGASGGIGDQIIRTIAEMDNVLGIYSSHKPDDPGNDKIEYIKLDLGVPDEINKFVETRGSQFSHITIVHMAGLKIDGLASNYSEADWDLMTNLNIKSTFLFTKSLLPHMVRDNWGRIIFISSRGALEGDTGTIAYSACKSALIGMSNTLAKEYARFNISSNVLVLGTFDTGMYQKLPENKKREILNKIPSKRLGNTSNISNAIKFIIDSEYVNGSMINIDGGM